MMILPFTSTQADVLLAGGKGANLARLTRAGFLITRGFIVSTEAYPAFVDANHLAHRISETLEAVAGLTSNDAAQDEVQHAAQLEVVSTCIRTVFSAAVMPTDLEVTLRLAYHELPGATSGATSGAATTEDLPSLSFAGQHDTCLNVIGADAVLKAVVRCWSSLWSTRAIGYRTARHEVNQVAVRE